MVLIREGVFMRRRTKRILKRGLCAVLFIALVVVIGLGTSENNKKKQQLDKIAQEESYKVKQVSQNEDVNSN